MPVPLIVLLGVLDITTELRALRSAGLSVSTGYVIRSIGWWAFAAAMAAALGWLVCWALELRRIYAALLAVAGFVVSGYVVYTYVQSTRSVDPFECIIPGPLLLWSPAAAAAVLGVGKWLSDRRSAEREREDTRLG